MKTVKVNALKTYDILIGEGLLESAGEIIRKAVGGQIAAVITDDIVGALYYKQLEVSLEENGFNVIKYIFKNGESSKNEEQLLSVLNFLAEKKISRTDIVIALGGGVVGDLAGFAASCYLRGVRFIQIPTTLLSAVDSSVGGKTAINLKEGKNLAGAFYQPSAVICDITLLDTLPEEVYKDGCAEMIKHSVIADKDLFNMYRMSIKNQYEETIMKNVTIKSDIVAKDEFEQGSRKLLNFGHTIGHAVEKLSGFKISHGHAVAIGMAIEIRMAERMGFCDNDCVNQLVEMLSYYKLPTTTIYNERELAKASLADKKRDGKKITLILPVEIGKCEMENVSVDSMEEIIKKALF